MTTRVYEEHRLFWRVSWLELVGQRAAEAAQDLERNKVSSLETWTSASLNDSIWVDD